MTRTGTTDIFVHKSPLAEPIFPYFSTKYGIAARYSQKETFPLIFPSSKGGGNGDKMKLQLFVKLPFILLPLLKPNCEDSFFLAAKRSLPPFLSLPPLWGKRLLLWGVWYFVVAELGC